jgi:hypothetical protein
MNDPDVRNSFPDAWLMFMRNQRTSQALAYQYQTFRLLWEVERWRGPAAGRWDMTTAMIDRRYI